MSDKMNFKVSSSLKNILGRDLITNDNIAVLELVKNSYDAHATKVEITFSDDKLVIADNGKGMSSEDLEKKWFFVGYSAKSDGTEDKSYRDKITRNYAGAKGIGRLSCDRLAKNLRMVTKGVESSITHQIEVDWDDFERDSTEELGNIEIPLTSLEKTPTFPSGGRTGTILMFTNLRTIWSKDLILSLRSSLEKLINPFAEAENFQIEIKAINLTIDEQQDVNGLIENRMTSILSLKTTQIESKLKGNTITTTLSDRGTLMYKIEEDNRYPHLKDVSINLFYLNRKAKYNFRMKMGVDAVNYGNVFLFRNGFRVYPYGEPEDDSWGLNKRAQQGYNRYLGTRDLIGRVDVETTNVDDFKEVSSRDGGLVETVASRELMKYFEKIHHLLERYVTGVLWGINFKNNAYFKDDEQSKIEKKRIQEIEKGSEDVKHVYDSVGSRADFVNLIKHLTSNSSIRIVEYNKDLVNIIKDTSAVNKLQGQFFENLRKVAKQVNDNELTQRIDYFEKELKELRARNEEAERKANKEERKRQKVEKELEQQAKQILFLKSVGNVDSERILNFLHDIRIQSCTIENVLRGMVGMINKKDIDRDSFSRKIELASRANARIMSISQFATKANFKSTSDSITTNIVEYIFQYVTQVLPDYYNDIKLSCITNNCSYQMTFKPLEVSLMVDNMLSNSVKAHAKNFIIEFSLTSEPKTTLIVSIVDDGIGLSNEISNAQKVFEKGITTTKGSGLGLYHVAQIVEKQLCGRIMVDDSYRASAERMGFKLLIII